MSVKEQTYQTLLLEDPEAQWELHRGHLREKPAMSAIHNQTSAHLGYFLMAQLDWSEYSVRIDAGRTKRLDETYYIPDVFVIPMALASSRLDLSVPVEMYEEPLPLVAEIWSPSTGTYDVESKIPEYQRRGDAEIWRVHPVEKTLTRWLRQADGQYTVESYRGGAISLHAIPSVTIDLDKLFTGTK